MKKTLLMALMAFFALNVSAAEEFFGGSTDFAVAEKRAEAEKKPMLLLFTGSDWCGYCIQLEKNVLVSDEFAKFVKEKVVFVYLDFPRRKPQDAKLKKQNEKLREKYEVEGYPTMIMLKNGESKIVAIGYGGDTAVDFVKKLEKEIE